MGGPGSGTWYRWNKKTCAEEVNRIDIRYMKKQGMLKPGYTGSLSWTSDGKPSGNIRYEMHSDKMVLLYKHRQHEDEWQEVKDIINIEETSCNYGGSRKWFTCPSCSKRVGVLYDHGKYFRCRKCTGMSYSSQSEGYLDRQVRKARKIRHKLTVNSQWWNADCLSDPIFLKPKGMHQITFDRLKRAEDLAQYEVNRAIVSRYRKVWGSQVFS